MEIKRMHTMVQKQRDTFPSFLLKLNTQKKENV